MAAKPRDVKRLKKLGQKMKASLNRLKAIDRARKQSKAHKDFVSKRTETVKKAILRRAEIERIDRQWEERGGSPLVSGKGKGIKKPGKKL